MLMPFDFQPWPLRDPADCFVIRVPAGLRKRSDLYDALALAGQFPAWFGHNWDALSDCLQDFSWVRQPQIAVIHDDVPLQHQLEVCRTYLQILLESVQDWRRREPGGTPAASPQPGRRGRLRVFFPRASFATVHRRLRWEIV